MASSKSLLIRHLGGQLSTLAESEPKPIGETIIKFTFPVV